MSILSLSIRRYTSSRSCLLPAVFCFCVLLLTEACAADSGGLLFSLSGDYGFSAEHAHGDSDPVFIENIELIPDGARGTGFRCPDFAQVFAFRCAGNIYAQRGTLAFWFRSRDPYGTAPYRLVQFSYADHSSFDMNWLRVDYNGSGWDAFVTDVNLAQTRVSYHPGELPGPNDWTHFALAWDENHGVRFYVNGRPAASKDTVAVYDAALGLFGTHGYFVNTHYVGWGSTFVRGGDFDEFRIYDHMLEPAQVNALAHGDDPGALDTVFPRSLDDPGFRREWDLRHGWNRTDTPPYLTASSTTVRKVEIHDVFDYKQWFWKGCDGIRETTWPGVHNRSRIIGRNDYFNLPDWNCYTVSGTTVTFTMPDEPWNYIEIAGAAFGDADCISWDTSTSAFREECIFTRPRDQERTFHSSPKLFMGGKLRFTNVEQETPIGELSAFHVAPGRPPEGRVKLSYTVRPDAAPDYPAIDDLLQWIEGRFPPDERAAVVALPAGAPSKRLEHPRSASLPVVHVLVPFEFRTLRPKSRTSGFSYTWENMYDGLDGISVSIPSLDLAPAHDRLIPMNIRVADPLWPLRSLMDFSFSVKPGEARTLWLDLRDKILPDGRSFLITVSSASDGFNAMSLAGAEISLVFKDRDDARKEHEADRFIQVKDNLGNIVESNPNNKSLDLYDRFSLDIADLLRVNPKHDPGIYYWKHKNPEQGWPSFEQPKAPDGVPLWAFRQAETLKLTRHFIDWWIDNRQIENGELGGGLSDDGDWTPHLPGAAMLGIEPAKYKSAVDRILEAFYDDGMFMDGLPAITTDELHVYEDGIQNIPQAMMVGYGSPKTVERLMETAKAYERITGIADDGHRHIISSFFGGGKIYSEGVWARANTHYSHLILHAGMCLVEFNGHPAAKKLLLEIADGILGHRKKDANGRYYLPGDIMFPGGEEMGGDYVGRYINFIFWAAYRWTGDTKYLQPIEDVLSSKNYFGLNNLPSNLMDMLGRRSTWGADMVRLAAPQGVKTMTYGWGDQTNTFYRFAAWQMTGDKGYLESMYADQIQDHTQRMYLMTEGHWWTDRVDMVPIRELQRARLGGIAMMRVSFYPGHTIGWEFEPPALPESVAILIPDATPEKFTVIARNLESDPVRARMTGWDVAPGDWEFAQGIDTDGDDSPDASVEKKTVLFAKSESLDIVFPSGETTILSMKLKRSSTPYWKRPDIGIDPEDVRVSGNTVTVTIHSLGSVDAPPSRVRILAPDGSELASADAPSIPAPLDFLPKTHRAELRVPAGCSLKGCRVVMGLLKSGDEITMLNNEVVVE